MTDASDNQEEPAKPAPRCQNCSCAVGRSGELCLSCRSEEMERGGWKAVYDGHGASYGHQRIKHLPEHGD